VESVARIEGGLIGRAPKTVVKEAEMEITREEQEIWDEIHEQEEEERLEDELEREGVEFGVPRRPRSTSGDLEWEPG
jgi:hypothetical protein